MLVRKQLHYQICWKYIRLNSFESIRHSSLAVSNSPLASFNIPKANPPGHFENIANQRQFFDELAKKLNIRDLEDWYQVPSKTLLATGASYYFPSLHNKFRTLL